ncbi:MAG: tetratricopeptide repeat protein, partial [Bryobacteraceae bacterium]
HVESVAWIAERKGVLSTFFFMLALWAYARYVSSVECRVSRTADTPSPVTRHSSPAIHHPSLFYILALFSFVCGLMSKTMVVTLPVVLLLLDWWPLQRLQRSTLGRRVWEKLPFFAGGLVCGILTVYAEQAVGALPSGAACPFGGRIANAILSYARYLLQTVWPANLAVIYPYPKTFAAWPVAGAAVSLLIISTVALRMARHRPCFAVGWLWYLVTLLPVIGLIQVGIHARADRYTYIPLIGVFVSLVWGIADWLEHFKYRTATAVALTAATLFLCGLGSARQLQYWKNGVTLFSHAINVTADNALAHNNLATALAAAGKETEAMQEYTEALRLNPGDRIIWNDFGNALAAAGQKSAALDHYAAAARLDSGNPVIQENYGTALAREGRIDEAIAHYSEAIRLRPNYAEAYNNLGAVLSGQGRLNEAVSNFNKALSLDPRHAETHNNLGGALAMQNKHAEAIVHYNEALRLGLRKTELYFNLGLSLFKLGKIDEASGRFSEVVRADPGALESRYQLGRCLVLRGQPEDAVAQFSEILRQKPDDARAHFSLGAVLVDLRQTRSGIEHLREAIRLRPNWSDPLNVLAWVLATNESEQVRNGPEAVRLAETAVEVTGRREPLILNTLAAAYAEAGRFDDAADIANRALDLARSSGQTNLAATIQAALELYKTRRPFRHSHDR